MYADEGAVRSIGEIAHRSQSGFNPPARVRHGRAQEAGHALPQDKIAEPLQRLRRRVHDIEAVAAVKVQVDKAGQDIAAGSIQAPVIRLRNDIGCAAELADAPAADDQRVAADEALILPNDAVFNACTRQT